MVKTTLQTRAVYKGDLSSPEAIPEEGITRAVEIMRAGSLHRYGEDRSGVDEVSAFEQEFAAYMGARYALGVNSCGGAMFIALKALGVKPGDSVLLNAFTLAPVPGAVAHAGARHVLVDIRDDLTIDLADLDRKAEESGARVLLLSHMRGHISDMEAVAEICKRRKIRMIEDCAHTVGARWDGRLSGSFGDVSCFSSQAFKHLNSGEGGIITTNDEDVAARAILLSGSYMLYPQHQARPPVEVFDRHKLDTPNCSMRMSTLVGAILRPQLRELDARCQRWTESYRRLETALSPIDHLRVTVRDPREQFVGSSLQFAITDFDVDQINSLTTISDAHGVHVKWFGRADPKGFTSRYTSWNYVDTKTVLAHTDTVLDGLCDIRVPVDLSAADCSTIAEVIRQAIEEVLSSS